MDTTNPFQSKPARLARLPRIVRFFIFHSLMGFALSAVFTTAAIWFNIANIGYLVTHVSGGTLATGLLFLASGIVFAAVQISIAIITMPYDDH